MVTSSWLSEKGRGFKFCVVSTHVFTINVLTNRRSFEAESHRGYQSQAQSRSHDISRIYTTELFVEIIVWEIVSWTWLISYFWETACSETSAESDVSFASYAPWSQCSLLSSWNLRFSAQALSFVLQTNCIHMGLVTAIGSIFVFSTRKPSNRR